MATMFFGPIGMKSYRGTSCKILLYLAKWFKRRRFLEIDQPETRIAYGSHVCLSYF
jgi:hypothetical protein